MNMWAIEWSCVSITDYYNEAGKFLHDWNDEYDMSAALRNDIICSKEWMRVWMCMEHIDVGCASVQSHRCAHLAV